MPLSRASEDGVWPSGKAMDFESIIQRFDPFYSSIPQLLLKAKGPFFGIAKATLAKGQRA